MRTQSIAGILTGPSQSRAAASADGTGTGTHPSLFHGSETWNRASFRLDPRSSTAAGLSFFHRWLIDKMTK